ncbi:hypothetical protein C0J52_20144 [Blattella germanica]|nr:hypothetical protein C0J52_20144 [Blattella germanica]
MKACILLYLLKVSLTVRAICALCYRTNEDTRAAGMSGILCKFSYTKHLSETVVLCASYRRLLGHLFDANTQCHMQRPSVSTSIVGAECRACAVCRTFEINLCIFNDLVHHSVLMKIMNSC